MTSTILETNTICVHTISTSFLHVLILKFYNILVCRFKQLFTLVTFKMYEHKIREYIRNYGISSV